MDFKKLKNINGRLRIRGTLKINESLSKVIILIDLISLEKPHDKYLVVCYFR